MKELAWLGTMSMVLAPLAVQDTTLVRARADSVTLRFVETDLRAAIRALASLLSKPIVLGDIAPAKVTFETPVAIPRHRVPDILRAIVDGHGMVLTEDSLLYRLGPRLPEAPQRADSPQLIEPAAPELHVVRLKHARAADVAATINLLFGAGGEFSSRPGLSSGTLTDELRRSAESSGAQGDRPQTTRPAMLIGPVTIVPDELTNALLVRANASDVALLEQAIRELDVRPLQVLIEVLIVESRKDRALSFGVSADFDRTDGKRRYQAGYGAASTGDVVLQFMRLGKSEVSAVLSAAQSRGDVEIVSRPVLVASNNTEARFLVGSQRPFVQVSRSLPTDVPSRDQVVQYRDVGTKLTIRPTINQDGYVSLVIQQEISGATDETQFGAPVISSREARTQVLVKDGQTIMLGGLRDKQRDRNRSGVPLLSGIPVIGALFGSSRVRANSTELFLFLTPHIIRTDADADSLTAQRLPNLLPK